MRSDAIGMFWQDFDAKVKKKEDFLLEVKWCKQGSKWGKIAHKIDDIIPIELLYSLDEAYKEGRKAPKRTPPEPVWLEPDYLPNLEEARSFKVDLMSNDDLISAQLAGEALVFDIECYKNYFLIAFRSTVSGKVFYTEKFNGQELDYPKIAWVFANFKVISFNGIKYDMPMWAVACLGVDTYQLKAANDLLISSNMRSYDMMKRFKATKINCDHIDLIEVAPLSGSLKTYAGRLHTRRMQDLPFDPSNELSFEQVQIMRWYCINDLIETNELFDALYKPIALREMMGSELKIDLRSKSDAQVAEAVINKEIQNITGKRVRRPQIQPGNIFYYQVPSYLKFESDLMNWVLDQVSTTPFIVNDKGRIGMPENLAEMLIPLGMGIYQMGIGGLHSTEHNQAIIAHEGKKLFERDVVSYYPFIILNQGLYPSHLGSIFLKVFSKIVYRRLAAKEQGNKDTAHSLKITVNGSFGKLGSPYSILYSPNLLIQVTLSGQLSLLMLIERYELAGISVVSANTDGVVVYPDEDQYELANQIIEQWELDTGFKTEETQYHALFSRDVNNYIGVKVAGGLKGKGAYSRAGLQKNPTNEICIDAIENFLLTGKSIEETVNECDNMSRFVTVRNVKGGGVKDGLFLGKVVRWYYGTPKEDVPDDYLDEIIYASSGNKVPKSDGARPLMTMTSEVSNDLDRQWYIAEINSILVDIGFTKPEVESTEE